MAQFGNLGIGRSGDHLYTAFTSNTPGNLISLPDGICVDFPVDLYRGIRHN